MLSAADIARLATCIEKRYEAAVWLAAETGSRWGEVFGLKVRSVDLESRRLQIERGLTRSKSGAPIEGRLGSEKARPRSIPISERLAAILESHLDGLISRQPEDWLFPDTMGGPVRYSNWRRRIWMPALIRADLDQLEVRLGSHDFRRFNATELWASGVDSRTVMHRLGHTTPGLSLSTYAQPDEAAGRQATEAVERHLFGSESHVGRTMPEELEAG